MGKVILLRIPQLGLHPFSFASCSRSDIAKRQFPHALRKYI